MGRYASDRPNDPTKKTNPFDCLWAHNEKIAHLDRCAMYNVAPRDYVWPVLEDFYWPERHELLKQWGENKPEDKFSMLNMGADYWEHMWRLLGAEDALLITVEDPDTFDYILDGLRSYCNFVVAPVFYAPCRYVGKILNFTTRCGILSSIIG